MINHFIAKVGLIFILFILIFFTNACKNQSEQQIANKQSQDLNGQIFLWEEIPPGLTEAQVNKQKKVLKDTIEKFRELYPQVEVFVEFLPTGNILKQSQLELKRGAGPDLILVYSNRQIFKLIETGSFRTVEESEVDLSQFRPESLKQVRYQGKLYGFPLNLVTQVLCYNKEKVRELPRTLTELIQQARRGYSVGVQSGFVETFWGTGIFGGKAFDEQGRFILAQGGGWAKWMQWLKKAQNEPNFILSDDTEALKQAFVQRKLAYLTCSSSWIPYFREQLGEDKLGATLLPREENQPATPALFAGALFFNRASSPNQAQLALKLAQFLTNVEQQNQMEAAIPFISSNKNVTINPQLFPLRAVLLDQSRTAISTALDDAEKTEMIVEYGEIFYRQILSGEISPEKAALKFQQTVNHTLKQE